MNPAITTILEDGDILRFTLSGVNVSFANGLRRTILSSIDTVVFRTETYADNQCKIYENTGRLHNEIIKQRLSSIPIHSTNLETLPGHYVLEVNVSNDSDTMRIVTTDDFRIKNKESGNYLTDAETKKIFPPNNITHNYIDFVRLRPRLGDTIPGEKIHLTCEFAVANAKVNAMFNVVSKCSYGNTPDITKAKDRWEQIEQRLASEGSTKEEIEFQKTNFRVLDAERSYEPDSFDFVIQTLGVFDNKEIVTKACYVLQQKFAEMIEKLDSNEIPIHISETTVENSYDVILKDEDYTVGKIIEYILYEKYYKDETATYCGFKKVHPHDTQSIIRIAYKEPTDKHLCREHLKEACNSARDIFIRIYKIFKP
jgi:DNA-directed RNA polymerase alpha subunit/DNA-directed RNA polymerase subunit L